MKRHIITLIVACHVASTLCTVAWADEEIANGPVVISSKDGAVYAKSVPDEGYGQKGKTRVFTVAKDRDKLHCQYDWYANEFYIGGDGTVVRFGPWHRGFEPQDGHLAVGIYRNGKSIREYTTLEMQNLGSGVSKSKSHYVVFERRLGFRRLKGNAHTYEVEGVSGEVFSLDLDTGAIIQKSSGKVDARRSLEMVKSARLQDRDQLLKEWQQLPERLRNRLQNGSPLGLSAQGEVRLIGVYNIERVVLKRGDKEEPKRVFHLRQTNVFSGDLIRSILVNVEDETYRILFDANEISDRDASWLKLQAE